MSSLYPNVETADVAKTVPDSKVAPESKGAKPEYSTPPGPQLENRRCRDKLFLVLFFLFWVGMFVIAGLAIKEGNLNRLRYGNDSEGNLCGVKNVDGRDHTLNPYQYVFNPTTLDTYRMCVSSCPNATFKPICPYGITTPNIANLESLPVTEVAKMFSNNTFGNCTLTYRTKMIMNRCVPDVSALKDLTEKMSAANPNSTWVKNAAVLSDSGELATQIFSDLYNSWRIILYCSFIALALSFVWLFLVQFFARPLVWFTIIVTNMAAIGMTASLWAYYNKARKDTSDSSSEFAVSEMSASGEYNVQVLFGLAIIASVVTGLLLLLTIGLRKRIALAIAIIQETSKAIRKMPLIIFFPVFKYVALCFLVAWTIYIWANLATSGTKVSSSLITQAQRRNFTSVEFQPNRAFQYLTIYYALGFFWTFNWIVAISQATIAGAIATWYWAKDKSALPLAPVLKSFYRTMRFHLGSLAFGSLIIAIVQVIRAILMYIELQMKKHKESRVVTYLLACMQCCFACVEKVLKFLSKNAYIEIAIYGYDFCEGARTAFELLVRNAIRVMVIDRVSDFLFLLGKMMVTLLTCIIGAAMLQQPESLPGGDTIDIGRFWGVSLVLIAILSYTIASAFMAVFDMAINTVFLCFCEDSERNDGSAAKPYYMEESLRQFVDNAAKAAPKSIQA